MQRIFVGLASWCTLFLFAAFCLGFLTDPAHRAEAAPPAGPDYFEWHFLTGIFTALFTLVVHGIVMTYFLGMGGLVKEELRLLGSAGEEFRRRSRKIKMLVFPPATFAPLLVVATAVAGGAAGKSPASFPWHGLLAVVTFLYNLRSFQKEYVGLGLNRTLMDDVDRALKARGAGAAADPRPVP